MPLSQSERDFLFGIIALQNSLISRDELITAVNARASKQSSTLGETLVLQDALSTSELTIINQLVDHHVARNDGLLTADFPPLEWAEKVVADLRYSINDPDFQTILNTISYEPKLYGPFHSPGPGPSEVSPHVRFRKLRKHASGNLGVVYVALDEELNREVTIKEINEENADHPYFRAKFLLEAEVTGSLEHPGIVPVYGLGLHADGRPFYAMRFIRGRSLLDEISRFHSDSSLKIDSGRRMLELQKLIRTLCSQTLSRVERRCGKIDEKNGKCPIPPTSFDCSWYGLSSD